MRLLTKEFKEHCFCQGYWALRIQPSRKQAILQVLVFVRGEPLQVTPEELAAGGKRKFKFSRMTLCSGPVWLSLFLGD